jgi:nucleoside-diphosphate-sugar epimerase
VKILLTGATGFLGRALIPRLLERGELIALHRPGIKPPREDRIRWIAQDLASPLCAELPSRVDAVLHIAQSRRDREFPEGAVDVIEVNTLATTRLLDYCRRAGGETFVYASSGAISMPGPTPVTEDDVPAPTSLYGVSKRAGEEIVLQFRAYMRAHALRYFFIYGPDQQARMMPGIIDRVTRGREVQLAGHDGINLNPVYVDDAADATIAALDLEHSSTINVAGPEIVTIRRIAELIGSELKKRPRFATGPEQPDVVASIARMRSLLVSPATSPAEGLRRTITAS